jgi:HPt (histidine-containing phosphotransfer) domain-containing protein
MFHALMTPELKALLPGYLERRDKDARTLESSLFNKDFETIAAIAHKLKGNGTAFGFARISRTGEEMEKAAKEKDPDRLAILIQEFQETLAEIRRDG